MDEIEIFAGDDDVEFRDSSTGKYGKLKVDTLKRNLASFTEVLGEVIDSNNFQIPNASVDKIVFSLGVGASGKISLLGTGVSSTVNASIALHIDIEKPDV